MSDKSPPALTPEQWEARDYRQVARELDQWAKARSDAARSDDATEYVAKIGMDEGGSVVLMNRAHDRVMVPPPARAALAAFALLEQPFGFTAADVQALLRAAEGIEDSAARESLLDLSRRLEALLPAASD
jgi:hypothetical protein